MRSGVRLSGCEVHAPDSRRPSAGMMFTSVSIGKTSSAVVASSSAYKVLLNTDNPCQSPAPSAMLPSTMYLAGCKSVRCWRCFPVRYSRLPVTASPTQSPVPSEMLP